MPAAPDAPVAGAVDPASSGRYWPVPLLRAVPLLAVGLVTTFTLDHSPRVGLLGLGAAALGSGLVLALGSWRRLDDPSSRSLQVAQGAVGVVVGAAALLLADGGLPLLVGLVVAWALLTGVLELVAGLRRRRRTPLARDWSTVGVLTLLLAVVFLVVPPDYSRQLGGIEQVSGVLTSSTVLVGVLGAYGVLVGVFLVIAALSLRWQPAPVAAAGTTSDGVPTS